ncbi:Fanconi anemia group M protein [Synchiropus splendidus]|uniref:Fanconi anemia group M protein n=1 Tax=Synchiropus splendidus TaxID=270530 RepID=UPI00237E1F50|nr:Fanconi anemia group M protein [Synchiropus splendidus]
MSGGSNQRTLFQTWGSSAPQSKTSAPPPGTKKATTKRKATLNNPAKVPAAVPVRKPLWPEIGQQSCLTSDNPVVGNQVGEDDDLMLVAVYEAEKKIQDEETETVAPTATAGKTFPNLPGFDSSAADVWIYPTNYPVREYQLKISEAALFQNTLVCLPTGLGKTFVASVVMYNFYRWYPSAKIVFMAPTKPLVAQQIEACFHVMGIPQVHMAELTGTTAAKQRQEQWKSKRVFFLTPQVMVNDLARDTCPAQQVKCLVIDEAHKALGNHAYCQVIRQLASQTQQFRVLALSATPGSDVKAIQSVISNLLISHLELRSEESPDLQAYSHQRSVEKMVVPLGETLTGYQNLYLQILEKFTSRLVQNRAMTHKDLRTLTKYQMILARDQFRKNPPSHIQGPQLGMLEGDFALCISLCHGYELLLQTGLRSFFLYLQGIMDGSREMSRARNELQRTPMFLSLYQEMEAMFATPAAGIEAGPGPTEPFVYSHPKLEKLQEVVLQHFKDANMNEAAAGSGLQHASSRVMIFSSFRDSVQEIATMLNRHSPLIRVMTFMGQSSTGKGVKGFTQKEQLEVIQKFRQGDFNTLVSTCVGEEGLDIGEVDLIICFDAQKSPIRLVQRMGRTGRQRHGRIVVILTEGREERTYNTSQSNRRSVVKSIVNRSGLHMYPSSPRMLPEGLRPVLHKMYITSGQFVQRSSSVSRRSSRGRRSHSEGQSSLIHPRNLVDAESPLYGLSTLEYSDYTATMKLGEQEAQPTLETSHFLSLPQEPTTPVPSQGPSRILSLWEWRHWQYRLLPTHQVDHSLRCQHFVQLMALIDTMKYESEDECLYEQQLLPYLGKGPDQHVTRKRRKVSKQSTLAPISMLEYVNQEVHVGSPHEAGTVSSNLQTHDQMVISVPEDCPGFEKGIMEGGPLDAQEKLELPPRSGEDLDVDRTLKVILTNVAELLSRSPPPLPLDMDVFVEALKPETPIPFKVSFTLGLDDDDDDDGDGEGPMDEELQDPQPQPASRGSGEVRSPTWEDLFEDEDGGHQEPEEEVFVNYGEAEAASWTRVKHGDGSEEKDPGLTDDHSLDLFEDDEAFLQMTIPDVQTPGDALSPRTSKHTENLTASTSWAARSDHHGTHLKTTESRVHSDKRTSGDTTSADRSSWDHFSVNFDLGFSLDSDQEEEPPTSISPAPRGAPESSNPQTTAVYCSTPQNLLPRLSRQVNVPTPQSAAERRRGRTSLEASPLTCRGVAKPTGVSREPTPARPEQITSSSLRPEEKFVSDFSLLPVDSDSEEEVVVTKRRRQRNVVFSPDRTNISATDSPLLATRKRSKPLDTSEQMEDDDDFQSQHVFKLPACRSNSPRAAQPQTKPRAPNMARHFLDQEAELSEDEQVSSDEEDGNDQNCSLDGFVVNNSHLSQGLNDSEMRGVYLQSVRSPAARGKFKMSYRNFKNMDVFSQVPEQDETYAEDSFVVGSEEEEEEEEQSDAADEDMVELMPEDSYVDGRRQYATRRRVLQRRVRARNQDVVKPTRSKKSRVIRVVDSSEEEAEGGGVEEEKAVSVQPSSSSSAIQKPNDWCCQNIEPQNQLDVTGCHNQQPLKSPLRILVDSRCIGSSVELITRLRQQHGAMVHVCSLDGRYFIVSNRTAVERHVESYIAAMQNRKTLSERVTGLMGKFERVCLIVEKDRAKPGETSRPLQRTRYYDSTVAALVSSGARLLWSSGAEESADLLAELGRLEQRKGHGINVNPEIKGQRQLALQFCRSLPAVNQVQALNMTWHFPSMAAVVHSSVESLQKEASLSRSRAEELFRFLRHSCDTFVLNSLKSGKSH